MIRLHVRNDRVIVTDQIRGDAYLAYADDMPPTTFGHGFTREDAIDDLMHRLKPKVSLTK